MTDRISGWAVAAAMGLATIAVPHAAFARKAPVVAARTVLEGQQETEAAPAGGYPYLLFVPQGYQADKAENWPVIVFLHGKGERGDNLDIIKAHGPPKFLEKDPAFPFIVISPQVPLTEENWDPAKLDATYAAAIKGLRIDPDRVYLTGLSMGGIGTWAWASAHPGLFAAVAPVASRGDTATVCALKDMPVWAFHGDNDPIVKTADAFSIVSALRACGGDPRFTVYPSTGHWSWEQAYADPELYLWFLRQHRHPQ